MTQVPDRRRFLRHAAAGAVPLGLVLGATATPAEATTASVVGTWRAAVFREDDQEEALFAFLPGGFFLSFADGIHVAMGRWCATGTDRVTFSLWQVLPVDPEYRGEVQAVHHARIAGDILTSTGTGRLIDRDGNESFRTALRTRAVRFGVELF